VQTAGSNPPPTLIVAYSRRQVMDWSLVLASQDIESTIIQDDAAGWGLVVPAEHYERARETIRQYRLENRKWGWNPAVPWSDATFDWGATGWCLLFIVTHWVTWTSFPGLREAGLFDPGKFEAGEWWRAFTAVLLHADLRHLLANTTIGFLLLGLAMARYGAGVGSLAAFLAGALGNLAGLALHARPYYGLGASGMVMGALGLICVPPYRHWYSQRGALKQVLQAVIAGVFLFLLLGVDPASDVIAHIAGFVGGAGLSLILHFLPQGTLRKWPVRLTAWTALAGLLATTVFLAWRHR
jgi:rhomboid protease GluP